MFLFQISHKRRINIMCQYDRVLSLCLEHIDVLALLNFVCHIVNRRFLRLFILIVRICLHICFRCRLFGCLFFCSCSFTFIYNIF